ncbi:GntR family transcriptional regulator [Evansella vedderi]|uniref:GntR family transcriptional regulator n=1 Tax=Evansella vedderi TaxID=38282 RepID=A0ABT9ZP61_9BACI|nr:GntR family transcriptional regulator [Evansella vedderi]MDQ0252725.1 GntR family transcriptional regulator [Evansella vedderi]
MMQLQHNSVIPLYHQLKEILKASIDNGIWNPGDKIPSENELMSQYEVSRNTAKKAIEELVQDGILYRVQGKGTFVSKPKLEQSLTNFYSFSKVLKEKGMNPSDTLLNIENVFPTSKMKEALELSDGESVIEIKRLRSANKEPFILESSFLPSKFIKDIHVLNRIGTISLYDLLDEEFNITVSRAKEAFEPVLIRDNESNYLETEVGKPALLIERIAYTDKGVPIEFCKSIVRGDRCRFYTELTK